MDLIRELLISLELDRKPDTNEFSDSEILYHKSLLIEAGLAQGSSLVGDDVPIAITLHRLTWDGHEFLDNVKDDNMWQKIKALVVSKGGDASFSVLKALATKLALEHFL